MRQLRIETTASLPVHVGPYERAGRHDAKAIAFRRLDRPFGQSVGDASSAEPGAAASSARTGLARSEAAIVMANTPTLVKDCRLLTSPSWVRSDESID